MYEYNPWWKSSEFHIPEYRTKWFDSLTSAMDDLEIEIVYGPRQVGKTVLMKQVVKHLIENEHVLPHSIMYVSMDHTSIDMLCSMPVKDVIDVYSTYVKPSGSEKAYIFLDEIQTIANWSSYLKQFHDLQYPLKFIVSGSSSTEIDKGHSESLIGRSRLRLILQWKFADFVNFSLFKEEHPSRLCDMADAASVRNALIERDAGAMFDALLMYRDALLKNGTSIEKYVVDYIIKGGYPALLDADLETSRDALMERFGLTIHKETFYFLLIELGTSQNKSFNV